MKKVIKINKEEIEELPKESGIAQNLLKSLIDINDKLDKYFQGKEEKLTHKNQNKKP